MGTNLDLKHPTLAMTTSQTTKFSYLVASTQTISSPTVSALQNYGCLVPGCRNTWSCGSINYCEGQCLAQVSELCDKICHSLGYWHYFFQWLFVV